MRRYKSTVVSSYLGGSRAHFVMDPHDVNVFNREGPEKFSFFEKSLEFGVRFCGIDEAKLANVPGT